MLDYASKGRGDERRQSSRTRRFEAGLIANGGDAFVTGCLIRDQGRDGAQVRLRGAAWIAPGDYLIDLKRGCASRLLPVWRQSSLAGLRLSETFEIGDAIPGHLAFLRTLFENAHLRNFGIVNGF
jgi:hypothetical protein